MDNNSTTASTNGAQSEPVIIVDYDPSWVERFELERDLLQSEIGEPFGVEEIEHIGSTSVPGLAAKPVIDISMGVADLEVIRGAVPILERMGYTYVPKWEVELPFRLFFHKGTPRNVHLHVTETSHPFRQADLKFRDYLRAHPEVAGDYADLKRQLAATYQDDRIAYTMAKTDFISHIKDLAGAKGWRPE